MRKSAARAAAHHPAAGIDPTRLPPSYGMAVKGDCMAPAYPDGSFIRIARDEPYQRGDVVCIWLRTDLVKPGESPAIIKRIVMMPPPWVKAFPYKDNPKSDVRALVILGRDDQPGRAMQILCADVGAIHKVVGPLKPEECSFGGCDELATRERR